MGARPIIFAMANPDPEITPEKCPDPRRRDRRDRPLGLFRRSTRSRLPLYLPRALDVRASTINDAMKIAAAEALANLAKEDVPDDVAVPIRQPPALRAAILSFRPFDPRLISAIPMAVAKGHGDGRRPQADRDLKAYVQQLSRDATRSPRRSTHRRAVRRQPKRIVFAEGEEVQMMRSAIPMPTSSSARRSCSGARK